MLNTIIKIATIISMLFCCFIFFILLQKIGKKSADVGDVAKKSIDNLIKSQGVMSAYKIKMSKMGIMFRAKDYNLNPSWYVLVRATFGVILATLTWALFENILITLGGLIGGYFLVAIYFKKKNAEDNKEIKFDLYNAYVNLKIQLEAGVYIVNSLEYTHKTAKNKRFKEALGELIINFSDKTVSMSEAIEVFKNRFSSKDIDKFCALLHSCTLYGTQENYLKDIMNEIKSIAFANAKEIEDDVENKAGFITFGFFTIMIFIVAYSIFNNFSDIANFFA